MRCRFAGTLVSTALESATRFDVGACTKAPLPVVIALHTHETSSTATIASSRPSPERSAAETHHARLITTRKNPLQPPRRRSSQLGVSVGSTRGMGQTSLSDMRDLGWSAVHHCFQVVAYCSTDLILGNFS